MGPAWGGRSPPHCQVPSPYTLVGVATVVRRFEKVSESPSGSSMVTSYEIAPGTDSHVMTGTRSSESGFGPTTGDWSLRRKGLGKDQLSPTSELLSAFARTRQ